MKTRNSKLPQPVYALSCYFFDKNNEQLVYLFRVIKVARKYKYEIRSGIVGRTIEYFAYASTEKEATQIIISELVSKENANGVNSQNNHLNLDSLIQRIGETVISGKTSLTIAGELKKYLRFNGVKNDENYDFVLANYR